MPILKVAPSSKPSQVEESNNLARFKMSSVIGEIPSMTLLLIRVHDAKTMIPHPTYTICPCRCARQIRANELGISAIHHSEILFKYV